MILAWLAQAWARWHGEGVADLALIIQGEEGIGKTSVSQALAGGYQYYAEIDNFDMQGERPLAHIHGTRIVDVCEGAAFHKSSASSFKRFMSLRHLKITPKYSNTTINQPATWLTIGSVNDKEFLRYDGSNRRLIVVQSSAKAKSFDWEQHLGGGKDRELFIESAAVAKWLYDQGISPQSLLASVEAERTEALAKVEDRSPDQQALDDFVGRYEDGLAEEQAKLQKNPQHVSPLGELVDGEFVPYGLPLSCAEIRAMGVLPKRITTAMLVKSGLATIHHDLMDRSVTRARGVHLGDKGIPLPKRKFKGFVEWFRGIYSGV